jgi:RimJ/RimL family protein N-acetyltransferase
MMLYFAKKKQALEQITETQRLLIRKLTDDDAAFIFELVNTKEWLQNIGDRNVHSREDALRYLRDVHYKSYDDNGFGHYVVLLKNNLVPIGVCGFLKRDTLPGVDAGYAFLPAYFGRGYAFESASAIIQYAKDVLKFPSLYAIVLQVNLPSRKLLDRLGFVFEKKIKYPPANDELMLYKHPAF